MLANLPQAHAASDVSNSGSLSSQAVTSVVSPIASSQTTSIISGAISGGFAGGFSGTGGGFTPSSGTGGGFTPSQGSSLQGDPSGGGADSYETSHKTANMPFISTRNGRAGGGAASATGVWAQATAARASKDEEALKMHGSVYNAVFGLDHRFTSNVTAGLALSYELSDITTSYNNGSFEGSGVAVAPYIGITLSPRWSADLTLGHAWLDYDVERNDGSVKGSYDATRWFGAANLTGSFSSGAWRYQPKVGVLWSRERQGSYTETGNVNVEANTSSLGRLSASSKIGYVLGDGVPYVKVAGEWDFLTPDSVLKSNGSMSDDSHYGGVVGLGYEHYIGGFTGSVEMNYNSLLRDDFDLWTLALRMRWDF